jgi:hypothetical protein
MDQTVTTQELAIVVAADNLNPTILNPDFLKYSGIVPADWELARSPLYTNQMAQVIFQNGVSLVAQPDRIMFLEAIGNKADTDVQVAEIARKYIGILQQVKYQAIGINLRGYVSCKGEAGEAHQFLTQTLLSSGSWQDFGQEPVQTSINFVYTLKESRFNLSVNEATLQFPEEQTLPVILFSGNFSYALDEKADSERVEKIAQIIGNWQSDLDAYRDLINTKFLSQAPANAPSVPNLFAMSA